MIDGPLRPDESFDTDARRQAFALLRPSPPVAGQLRRSTVAWMEWKATPSPCWSVSD